MGRHRDEFSLGPPQGGEGASEHAAGVDADRAVHPGRGRYRGMAVDDRSTAPVVVGPRVADRQSELVGLAGRVAVEGERPDGSRRSTVHRLGQAGVGDDERTAVEHGVTDQRVDELGDLDTELGSLGVELFHGLGESVRPRDVPPVEGPLQLDLVVAGNAQGGSVRDHVHHEPEHCRGGRATVDEITEEHGEPTLRMSGSIPRAGLHDPAQFAQQVDQLVVAAVDIADDVEGSGEVAGGRSTQPLADRSRPRRSRRPRAARSDPAEPSRCSPLSDRRSAECWLRRTWPPKSRSVATRCARRRTSGLDIENDGAREHVVPLGQLNDRSTVLGSEVGRVDHRQQAAAPGAWPRSCTGRRTPWPSRSSFSSSLTSRRQKSDDSTSESLKWRVAKIDLPEPDTPTSATTQSSGIATVTV